MCGFGDPTPAELHPFRVFASGNRVAPATPGDLLLHIRADDMDQCFELATLLMRGLDGAATTVDEVHGFRYFDMRSIIGFVDGTENPRGRWRTWSLAARPATTTTCSTSAAR